MKVMTKTFETHTFLPESDYIDTDLASIVAPLNPDEAALIKNDVVTDTTELEHKLFKLDESINQLREHRGEVAQDTEEPREIAREISRIAFAAPQKASNLMTMLAGVTHDPLYHKVADQMIEQTTTSPGLAATEKVIADRAIQDMTANDTPPHEALIRAIGTQTQEIPVATETTETTEDHGLTVYASEDEEKDSPNPDTWQAPKAYSQVPGSDARALTPEQRSDIWRDKIRAERMAQIAFAENAARPLDEVKEKQAKDAEAAFERGVEDIPTGQQEGTRYNPFDDDEEYPKAS